MGTGAFLRNPPQNVPSCGGSQAMSSAHVSKHNHRSRMRHSKGSCSSPTAPAHLGHQEAAEPSQQLPQGTGMRTRHVPSALLTPALCHHSPQRPAGLFPIFVPSNLPHPKGNKHCGNSHCPPLSNLWFPVMG